MSTDTPTSPAPSLARSQRRRAVLASTVGTTIEWYDFFLYGTAAALVFPHIFFPGETPYAGVIASFGTQFVGFAARPIGAAIFGHYGDRIGRKATLITTLLLMGIGSTLIGVLPGYAAIGIAAPILLTVLRLVQGVAVGGEWGGSVLMSMEWGSQKRRGLMASWPQLGVPIGLLLSTAMVQLMSATTGPDFETWGWRVPFLASIVLVGIGLYVRLRVLESPAFAEVKQTQAVRKLPVIDAFRHQWREILTSAFVRMSEQAPFYLFITFVLAYGTTQLKLGRTGLLTDTLIAAAIGLISVPLFGHISDRDRAKADVRHRDRLHRTVRLPLLRVAQHADGRPGAARDRGVADLPRHAVRPAGRVDRRKLRHEHPLQRSRVGVSVCLRHRRRTGAADRRGNPAEHRIQHLDQHLHNRLLCGLDDRAAAHTAP